MKENHFQYLKFHAILVKISNLDLGRIKPLCVFGISKQTLKIFRMGLFWDAYDREEWGGRQKDPPSSKPITHATMKKLETVIPYLKKIKNNINHVTHLLNSASTSIFSLQISNFHYIGKYRYTSNFNTWFLILFTFLSL